MNTEFSNDIPIYIQLLSKIKAAIIKGEFNCGEKLPSVREFAQIFKVNPNTMQKALSDLEFEGLIYTERTNGKYVTYNADLIKKIKERQAEDIVRHYLNEMQKIGFTNNEAVSIIKKIGSDNSGID